MYSDDLILLTIYLLPNTHNLILITLCLLPKFVKPKKKILTLVTRNVKLDSFYMMVPTDYIVQILYAGICTPYFVIEIKLPDICSSYFQECELLYEWLV